MPSGAPGERGEGEGSVGNSLKITGLDTNRQPRTRARLTIIQAMFHDGWWQGLLALLLLAAVFAGMIYYTLKMLFGEPRSDHGREIAWVRHEAPRP